MNYKAENSRNVTCVALYNGPTEDVPYEIEKQLLVEVLGWFECDCFLRKFDSDYLVPVQGFLNFTCFAGNLRFSYFEQIASIKY